VWFEIMAILVLVVVSALVVTGFILMYKKWDRWSSSISIGILLCVPVLFYFGIVLILTINGGIGGAPSGWLVAITLLLCITLLVTTIVAVCVILRRIAKWIVKTWKRV